MQDGGVLYTVKKLKNKAPIGALIGKQGSVCMKKQNNKLLLDFRLNPCFGHEMAKKKIQPLKRSALVS